MWIFMNDAFLSIVAEKNDPSRLLVRARANGDIERVFPGHAIEYTPQRDYPYRASIPVARVRDAVAFAVETIDYGNFKDSVDDDMRHDSYATVWAVMRQFQFRMRKRANAKA